MLLVMADCRFSPSDIERIESISHELDGSIEEFFADARLTLSLDEWDLLKTYAGACIRRALDVGALLHAVVDQRRGTTFPYSGRGRETFVRAGLAAWKDAFAPIGDIWRLGPLFDKIEGGECRVLADVAALEVMAANRMFNPLDDQYAAFFSSE